MAGLKCNECDKIQSKENERMNVKEEIKFISYDGEKLPLIYCKDCNKDISTIAHHKSGLCIPCAKIKKLIFNY